MVKRIFNTKASKKVLAALMSAALVGTMVPVTVPTQIARVEAATDSGTSPAPENADATADTTTAKTFLDWETQDRTTAVTSGSIQAYVNGANVKISDDEKFNFKQSTVYTNISGTYHYQVDSKGKFKATTGKVIVAVSTSNDYSKGYDTSKNKYDTKDTVIANAKKIAKASIKNGIVTITAGTEAGIAYLHIVDTANPAGNHDTVQVNIVPAAAKIAITTGSAVDVTKDITNKKVNADKAITKASLNAGEDVIVYANALYTKDYDKIATGSSITAKVDDKNKDYFKVERATEKEAVSKPGQTAFKITCLKTKGGGKTSSATITFTCKESGKKTTLKMTGTSQIKTISATATAVTDVTVDANDKSKATVKVSTSTAISVEYTLDASDIYQNKDKNETTTDKIKVSSVLTETLSDDNWKANGTWDSAKNKSASANKVSVSMKNGKVTVKVNKNAVKGTYYVVVYTSSNKAGATKVLTVVVK